MGGIILKKAKLFGVVFSVTVMVLTLTGCAGQSEETPESSTDTLISELQESTGDEADGTAASTVTTGSEKKEDISYMEMCKEMLVEMAPTEIFTAKDNTANLKFEKHTYYSSTAERETNVNVLLPPDYSDSKKYPVLYILHGYFDNEDWMTREVVGINTMLQNLYASNEAKEMIVVVPYIFCNKDIPSCTGMNLENSLSYDNFVNDLTTDLMPFIESNFSVATGRDNTAITGFSMGGRESLFIGFTHSELFGYVGAVCPAPGLTKGTDLSQHPGQIEESQLTYGDNVPYLTLISASKKDGVVGSSPMQYHEMLTENNVEHLWHELSSTGHDHTSVKPHLYNYLRMIFKGQE